MKEREEKYEKRTQKDYSMPFKLSVVREIETTSIGLSAVARKYGIQSETTVKRWLEKYGTFDWENIKGKEMPKTKEQEIMELRQKLLLLEKKEKTLEDESVKVTRTLYLLVGELILKNALLSRNILANSI